MNGSIEVRYCYEIIEHPLIQKQIDSDSKGLIFNYRNGLVLFIHSHLFGRFFINYRLILRHTFHIFHGIKRFFPTLFSFFPNQTERHEKSPYIKIGWELYLTMIANVLLNDV